VFQSVVYCWYSIRILCCLVIQGRLYAVGNSPLFNLTIVERFWLYSAFLLPPCLHSWQKLWGFCRVGNPITDVVLRIVIHNIVAFLISHLQIAILPHSLLKCYHF